MRKGSVRILLGSTAKMGAGTNVQDRLIASHDLDCPWRPADLEQRKGRIVRQGNKNQEVYIYRYVTESTFDSYLYQTIENKQRFISQVMTSKSPVRNCQDVDETVLSYAEIKALCAGNPRIKEKMQLDIEVAKLKLAKSNHQSEIYRLQDKLRDFLPKSIKITQRQIETLKSDAQKYAQNSIETAHFDILIAGRHYGKPEEAGKAILAACRAHANATPAEIGEYRGFKLALSFQPFAKEFLLHIGGAGQYQIPLGDNALGNITRLKNALEKLPASLENHNQKLAELLRQVKIAQEEVVTPGFKNLTFCSTSTPPRISTQEQKTKIRSRSRRKLKRGSLRRERLEYKSSMRRRRPQKTAKSKPCWSAPGFCWGIIAQSCRANLAVHTLATSSRAAKITPFKRPAIPWGLFTISMKLRLSRRNFLSALAKTCKYLTTNRANAKLKANTSASTPLAEGGEN